jgi:HlyD family secretion protein
MLNRKILFAVLLTGLALAAVLVMASSPRVSATPEVVNRIESVPQPVAAPANTLKVIGTFVAPNQATLTFKGSGRIKEIRVQEGAVVKKGDTLAVLDTTTLELNVAQAQAALKVAQERLGQTQNGAPSADLAAAQAALDAAKTSYARVAARPTNDDLALAKANLDKAQAAVNQAQSAYDKVKDSPYIGMLPQSLALEQATSSYQAALAAYNLAKAHPTAAELKQAAALVSQAQAALARLQPTAENLAIAQAQVDQAQVALDLAQQQVADATLTAPVDGTIVWLGPHIGETVGPTTLFLTIADLAHLQLQVGVDETALGLIQVGQGVTIVPEAFQSKTLTGKVARLGWLATTTGGVINVPAWIDVDASDVPLRPGLSASAEIQIGAK